MGASRRTLTVVADATVVIHLARAGRLDILGRIEGYLFVVPDQVVDEVRYPEQAKVLASALDAGHLRREPSTDITELAVYADLRTRMGRGEAACLAMAACRGWVLASDDRRRAFRRLVRERIGEEKLIDTVGIVGLAEEQGVLPPEDAQRIRKLVEG